MLNKILIHLKYLIVGIMSFASFGLIIELCFYLGAETVTLIAGIPILYCLGRSIIELVHAKKK